MTVMDTSELWRPFGQPVLDAQRAFRAIMTGMSEPGTRHDLGLTYQSSNPDCSASMKAPKEVAAFVIALTLIDRDTRVWLSPRFQQSPMPTNLRFHCGCELVEETQDADFAILHLNDWQDLDRFKAGTEEQPHLSTTLILETPGLRSSHEAPAEGETPMSLSGPGINGSREIGILGLSVPQIELIQKNQKRFPLGLDMLFTCEEQMLGVSRTTQVTSPTASQENAACMSR